MRGESTLTFNLRFPRIPLLNPFKFIYSKISTSVKGYFSVKYRPSGYKSMPYTASFSEQSCINTMKVLKLFEVNKMLHSKYAGLKILTFIFRVFYTPLMDE
jgi:hypothetical protein